jgi:anaerobic selenocysteine-containing dehydrogenase
VHVLFEEGIAAPGERIATITDGIEAVAELAEPFKPEAVAAVTGIEADDVRRMARELAAAPHAAVYGRIGTTTQEFGTLTSWLVDVLNLLTGNLDQEGGAMFPLGAAGHANAAGPPGRGRGMRFGRWSSRVRGLPEVFGELPAACLAEEIETPGDGQVRALITSAGNPVVSTPNSARLDAALEQLELMISLDAYVNETTRHADVILPAPSPLHRSHYDLALYQFAVRNVANYSPPVLAPDPELPDEWVTILRLAGIAFGLGPQADVAMLDEQVARTLIERETKSETSPFNGRSVDEVLAELEPRVGPERLLDLMLRAGPYRLTLADLEAAPHGLDLGPLQPRLPDALRTASGMIELAPGPLVADVPRLRAALERGSANGGLVLVGRRHLRSNNSWMHNLPVLARGPERCTLHVHPDDAARLSLLDGGSAEVRSRTGALTATVEVTEDIMPGVVSLPHGWGHDVPGTKLRVAAERPGANSNLLSDELLLDAVSGNAVLNGIPVQVAPVGAPAEPALSTA